MAYEYFSDEEHLQEWLRVEKDPKEFKRFLDKNIYNCKGHIDYINLNGGMEKMLTLRKKEILFHHKERTGGGDI
jgi:glutaconate CoA-transferase subunit A